MQAGEEGEVLEVKQATLPPGAAVAEKERLQMELRRIEAERKRLESLEASESPEEREKRLKEEQEAEEARFLAEEAEREEAKRLAALAEQQKKIVASLPVTALVPPLPATVAEQPPKSAEEQGIFKRLFGF